MDYKQGFEDAVTMFEDAINATISEGKNDLDKVITTLYTISLRWDDIYERAMGESLDKFDYTDDNEFASFVIEMTTEQSSELNKILKEMFDNE